MTGESAPYKKEVFSPKPIALVQFELDIETEELADSEDIVSLADFNTKVTAAFDALISGLDNLLSYENSITSEIKYTAPKPTEPVAEPPKSPFRQPRNIIVWAAKTHP